jgi:hypothetical protein
MDEQITGIGKHRWLNFVVECKEVMRPPVARSGVIKRPEKPSGWRRALYSKYYQLLINRYLFHRPEGVRGATE